MNLPKILLLTSVILSPFVSSAAELVAETQFSIPGTVNIQPVAKQSKKVPVRIKRAVPGIPKKSTVRQPVMTDPTLPLSHATVKFSRLLNDSADAFQINPPQAITSRSYSLKISANDFNKGVEIFTTAPGAIVRITPFVQKTSLQQKTLFAIEPENLRVSGDNGSLAITDNGMELMSKSSAMSQTSDQMFKMSSAFKIAKALGAGKFVLKSNKKFNSNNPFIVQVFDKNSNEILTASSNKYAYNLQDTLSVNAVLKNSQRINKLKAQLVSPAGNSYPVTFTQSQKGVFRLNQPLHLTENRNPGELWEVQLRVDGMSNQKRTIRDIRIPIDIHRQSANFTRNINQRSMPTRSLIEIPLNVKANGRYVVQGIIYGTDSAGRKVPVLDVQTAKWLNTGRNYIELSVTKSKLLSSGLSAPFFLQQLSLKDQSRMADLQNQFFNLKIKFKEIRLPIKGRRLR